MGADTRRTDVTVATTLVWSSPPFGRGGRTPDDVGVEHAFRRAVALAEEALEAGDEPFGSVLLDTEGRVLAEDRNRIGSGDATRHPEFALARWAARHLRPDARAAATVVTSGEHCPMCAAAHAWVGLGPIHYVHSSAQLAGWLAEFGVAPPPVRTLPIADVAPRIAVNGPVDHLVPAMRELHRRCHQDRPRSSGGPQGEVAGATVTSTRPQ